MTDAHLMDAECVHGVTWWECTECHQPEITPDYLAGYRDGYVDADNGVEHRYPMDGS